MGPRLTRSRHVRSSLLSAFSGPQSGAARCHHAVTLWTRYGALYDCRIIIIIIIIRRQRLPWPLSKRRLVTGSPRSCHICKATDLDMAVYRPTFCPMQTESTAPTKYCPNSMTRVVPTNIRALEFEHDFACTRQYVHLCFVMNFYFYFFFAQKPNIKMNKHVNKVRKATGRVEAITAGRQQNKQQYLIIHLMKKKESLSWVLAKWYFAVLELWMSPLQWVLNW